MPRTRPPAMPASPFSRAPWLRFSAWIAPVSAAVAVVLVFLRTREHPAPSPLPPPPDAVARVGSVFVTESQLWDRLQRRHRTASPRADRDAALEEQIRQALLFAEAESSGFTARPELRDAWRALVVRRFSESLEQDRDERLAPSEADIAAHYAAHAEAYSTPERRRLAVLFLPLPASADGAKRRAVEDECRSLHERALAAAEDPKGFAALAARHSAHLASRHAGGDVGWLQRAGASRAWPTAVVDAAFALPHDGAVSAPIATDEGWYLVRRSELQPAHPQPLERVRDRIRLELVRARTEAAAAAQFAEWRSRHDVEIYDDRVAALEEKAARSPTPPPSTLAQTPPSLPVP